MRIRATTRYQNEIIISRRKTLGLTQIEYSKRLGISISRLQKIEGFYGSSPISDEAIAAFKEAIDRLAHDCACPPDEIWPEWASLVPSKTIRNATIRYAALDYKGRQEARFLLDAPDAPRGGLSGYLGLEQEDVEGAMENLTFRERNILALRFGLYGVSPETLKECGCRFGISKDRVRILEQEGLKKLRQKLTALMDLRERKVGAG